MSFLVYFLEFFFNYSILLLKIKLLAVKFNSSENEGNIQKHTEFFWEQKLAS